MWKVLKEPAQLSFQFMGTKWDGVLNNCAIADMDAIGKEAQLRGFEFARSITLVAEPFTMENGLLTPTFKLPSVSSIWLLTEEGLTGVLNRGHFGPDSNKKTGQHKDIFLMELKDVTVPIVGIITRSKESQYTFKYFPQIPPHIFM
ncbi:hypothetical protein LXL04_020399 [Taraxacum kok-saghyz]